ncbi:MAG TPA: YCF48-related protein [Pirellulales bacterium]|nr:YCF48-related protein [Pirellulales bacterium]
MDGQLGRRFFVLCCRVSLGACLFACAAGPAGASDQPPPWLREMQEDAELTDVAFVDAQHGWAAGDRGVIWATIDGGKHWRAQSTGLACRLTSIHFLNAESGWAAGGWFHPYTHTSRGVLLRTRDGGRTWAQDKGLMLPSLKRVKFFSGNVGWACGEPSALFPSGVFVTDNGGRTWDPMLGMDGPGWLAADFVDPHNGAAAGRAGTLAAVRRRALQPARTPGFGLRGLNRLKFSGEKEGWLVGDGGLVLTTADLGASWQLPAGDPAAEIGADFDWHALEIRGSRLWIAGSPGSKVLTSPDGGKTWQAFDTGQTLPLRALAFSDNLHGWAVGALGTILGTIDGGRTWQRQHSGGTRAAWLALYGRAEDVPLELAARLSGNEGYLGAVQLLMRSDADAGSASQSLTERSHAALVEAGASHAQTAWNFPSSPPEIARTAEQIVESWNRLNDGDGIDRVQAQVVEQIRCWRPEIVVTHAASLKGERPAAHLMNQIVLGAVEQAADPTCFPEQIGQMGLPAWQVRKVFGSLPDGQIGDLNLSTSQLAQRLGESLADRAMTPRGLIFERYAAVPANLGFRLYVDTLPQRVGEHDFFSGIALHPGGDARRMISEFSTQGIDLLRRMSQKQRNVQAMITRSERGQLDSARYLAEINDLTSGLDATRAGNVVYQLAEHYRQSGKWGLAAETFALLAQQHPDHPLSEAALVWLVRYWSSGEVAWHLRRAAQASGRQATDAQVAGQVTMFPPATALGQVLPGRNQVASQTDSGQMRGRALVIDNTLESDWAARAAALGKLLEQRSPATFAEPTVRFALASAHRKQGMTKPAERYYDDVTRLRAHDAWWACAAGEHWLNDPKDQPPKSVLRAASGAKPRLDGQLDDDIWQHAQRVDLKGPLPEDVDCPAKAMLAYDGEFLYLAVECRQAPGVAYAPSESPRPRDPNLDGQDRVDFYFDLDRDWSTWFRLSVDHRGWTGEACWDDARWNPEWFVAAGHHEETWTVEAAIAWAELVPQPPHAREAWALGIQRTIPGVGLQSWTTPAAAAVVPEGFGYLIFD